MARVKFETYNYTVPTHYLSWLINGDATSLSDAEFEEIQHFESRLPGAGRWALPDDIDDASYFTKWNDVHDLGSDCIDLKYMCRV